MGRPRVLSRGPGAYECFLPAPDADSAPVLLLGVGPFPADAPVSGRKVFFVECPDFCAAMPDSWSRTRPAHWQETPPQAAPRLALFCSVWRYRQADRLFNAFWGPVLAATRAARLEAGRTASAQESEPWVLLPGNRNELLTHELGQALAECGLRVHRLPGSDLPAKLPDLLRQQRPALLLSINGRGLDAQGAVFHLLQVCNVPVVIWMVDNPWHILSSWSLPWWRKAVLCVTDAAYLPGLRRHGARHVLHLPLGAWMPPGRACGDPLQPLVFVGRSAFPNKQAFFAGLRPDATLMAEASALLAANPVRAGAPDFLWWAERLRVPLWPGKAVRRIGLGAETSSRQYRALWLRHAQRAGLTVFGDEGWKDLVPAQARAPFDLRPPLDYYAGLADVYASASYSLGLTSLLLPGALTQRHFDVWTAGGFLLTDATPGLEIFPAELVREISLESPCELERRLERLERDPALYRHLGAAWRACLARGHTLADRVDTLYGFVKQRGNPAKKNAGF
jgi:hypothetical protein